MHSQNHFKPKCSYGISLNGVAELYEFLETDCGIFFDLASAWIKYSCRFMLCYGYVLFVLSYYKSWYKIFVIDLLQLYHMISDMFHIHCPLWVLLWIDEMYLCICISHCSICYILVGNLCSLDIFLLGYSNVFK